MSNLWFEIKGHFGIHGCWYVAVVMALLFAFVLWSLPWESQPRPITITQQAEGTIVSIRATGAWENWCKIELKFDDGTVLLASYGFIRKYNIREGRQYSICHNSHYGRIATELETE